MAGLSSDINSTRLWLSLKVGTTSEKARRSAEGRARTTRSPVGTGERPPERLTETSLRIEGPFHCSTAGGSQSRMRREISGVPVSCSSDFVSTLAQLLTRFCVLFEYGRGVKKSPLATHSGENENARNLDQEHGAIAGNDHDRRRVVRAANDNAAPGNGRPERRSCDWCS